MEAWNERHSIVRDREYRFTPDFEDAPLYEIFREAGKLDIRGRIPIAGVDLVDAKLAKANLSFADLTEADLTLADLTDVTLWGASLVGTKLHYTDLTRANLTTSEPWKASLYPSVIRSPKQRPDEAGLVKSIEDLLLRIQVLRDCYGEAVTLYFRGEFECGWDLRPSVMRNDLAAFESGMLVDLMSRRPGEFSGMTSALAQWVLAQHHGLQTRFLDVTRNPLGCPVPCLSQNWSGGPQ